MTEINTEEIKKYRRGELAGNIALGVCGAALIFFAAAFGTARANGLKSLELAALIASPVIMALSAAAAAFCNIRYGGAMTEAIRKFVIAVCVDNAALLHPERTSLTFNIAVEGNAVTLQTNGYKEKLRFDFGVFGRLPLTRKVSALTEIENRLIITFCRLYERGARYTEVSFAERAGTRRRSGKPVYIIKEGQPDKKSYKIYLKNR